MFSVFQLCLFTGEGGVPLQGSSHAPHVQGPSLGPLPGCRTPALVPLRHVHTCSIWTPLYRGPKAPPPPARQVQTCTL